MPVLGIAIYLRMRIWQKSVFICLNEVVIRLQNHGRKSHPL